MRIQACGTSRLENGSNIIRWKDRDAKEMKDRFQGYPNCWIWSPRINQNYMRMFMRSSFNILLKFWHGMAAVSFLRLACVTDPTRLGLGLVSGCIHSTPTLSGVMCIGLIVWRL